MLVLIYPTTRVMILVFALVYLVTRTPKTHLLFQFPVLHCQSYPNALRAYTYSSN